MLLGFSSLFSLILLSLDRVLGQDNKGKNVLDRQVDHKLGRGTWF